MQQEVQAKTQQSDNLARLQQARFGAKKTKTQASLHATRYSNRLQNLQPTFAAPKTRQTTDEEYDQEGQDEEDSQKNYATRWSMLQASTALARITQEDEEEKQELEQEESAKQNQKKQRMAQAAIKRGGMMAANSIAGALDSTGIGFLIGFFVHLGSIIELFFLEMIYGKHMAKGKSKIFPPISWDPIPISAIDPDATILQVFIVVAVIALAVASIILGAGSLCFLHDYVKFIASPIQTVANAASGGEGMCLGGIIPLIFGL